MADALLSQLDLIEIRLADGSPFVAAEADLLGERQARARERLRALAHHLGRRAAAEAMRSGAAPSTTSPTETR